MTSDRFMELFSRRSRGEFSRDPSSMASFLTDMGFQRSEVAIVRTMSRECPDALSRLLDGGLTPEEAARIVSEDAGVEYGRAKELLEEMQSGPNDPVHRITRASTAEMDGMRFEMANGEATLVGCEGDRPWFRIPQEVRGCPVVAIGKQAF